MRRIVFALLTLLLLTPCRGASRNPVPKGVQTTVYQNGQVIRIYDRSVTEPVRIFVISDTHLFRSDEREDPYRQYSKRMSKAYNTTRHFLSGKPTNPEESLLQTLSLAREKKADAIAVLGDLVSYPSEAGVEWAKAVLDSCGIPWFYTTGNHDWHYEGTEGSEIDLREEWTRKRLLPLYKGYNHECYSVTVKGIKLIFVDNATYQILPSQLKAFSAEIKGKEPKLLFGHIPYYAPGYGITTVAHPDWGYDTDRGYRAERRERWPVDGFNKTTMDFWRAILKATRRNHLVASFSGHHHVQQTAIVDSWTQFTVAANCQGGYFEVVIEPMP